MTEWREFKIKDIGTVITGTTPSSKIPEYFGTDIPFVTPTDFKYYFKYCDRTDRFLSKIGADKYKNRLLPPQSVLVTCIGSDMGKVAISKEVVITNQQINSIIVSSEFSSDFVYYSLIAIYDTLRTYGQSGTAVPIVNKTDFENITLLIPPLPEQKAIAEVLSSLDDKIDLLTRQNNTLEDLGQAFFRKWFVEDADEKLKKYPLSELMVIQNGFAFRSRDYQDAGKYKIVTIKNVQDGFIDTSRTTFLNQLPVGMPDYVLLTIGDVLISLTGNVGRVGIVVEDNLLLNQRVAKISPYNPEYLPFLYFYFRNETTREYLINLAHGTAQANLSPIETLKTEVSFSKTLIKKYSELFMPMYQKIIKNKQQIIVLQKLRDTLLPKLISGEVRVKQ